MVCDYTYMHGHDPVNSCFEDCAMRVVDLTSFFEVNLSIFCVRF